MKADYDKPTGRGTQQRTCRIRVHERGKLLGFLAPGGKINRLKVHASLMTRTDAERAQHLLQDDRQAQARGATFSIVEE